MNDKRYMICYNSDKIVNNINQHENDILFLVSLSLEYTRRRKGSPHILLIKAVFRCEV